MNRPHGIGGSDAAAALGVSPYESPVALWLRLTGRTAPREVGEAAEWGTRLQPLLAERLGEEGYDVMPAPDETIEGPHPFMFGHLDGFASVNGANEKDPEGAPGGDGPQSVATLDPPAHHRGVAELKTCSLRLAQQWDDGIPLHYAAQGYHYMACTGLPFVVFGCLIGGQRFITARLDRNDTVLEAVVNAEEKFWRHVEKDEPPPPQGADSATLSLLWPKDDGTAVGIDGTLVDELRKARDWRKKAEAAEENAEAAVKAALGEASIGTVSGVKAVTWKAHEQSRVDTTRLKAEYPDIHALLCQPRTVRPLRVI